MINRKTIRYCFFASLLSLASCSFLTELRLDMADRLFGREPPNPPAELKEIMPTLSVKLNWSTQFGKTDRYDYTPAVEAGAVYAANAEGELTKWDVETGRQIWRVNADEAISGGVGVGGGLVMVGTNRGHVIAYDFNGKLVWKSQLSSEILSAPRYADSLVIVRSGDNHLYGLDAIDGSTKWVYERKVPALSLRSTAGFIVDGGAVYAGFSGGKMAAVRADNGKLLWEATVAIPKGVTEIERIADITSLPVVAGPIVYAVAYQGRIAAMDRLTGKVLWNREISSYSGIAHDDTKLYVSHALGSIYSLNDDTGRTYWRQGDLSNRRLTTPLVLKDYVAVGDLEGYVHFLDIENGQFAAQIKVDDEAVMSMVKGESTSQLIAATRGGGLYAVGIGNKLISKETTLPKLEPQVESTQNDTETESTTEADEGGSEEQRSILFEQDSVFSPAPRESSGPGITLPRAQ
ncbi:MAG: outer membrane protein assembly factor BamB [Methylotenera sp.]